MDMEALLKLSSFQTWLDSKEPEAYIGLPSTKDSCPIAVYLREKTGKTFYVRTGIITEPERLSDSGHFICCLPPWAKELVACVDATIRFPNEVKAQQVKDMIATMLKYQQEWV